MKDYGDEIHNISSARVNPEASLAAAYYPGKAAWKNEPGNRYTREELSAMDHGWEIQIINPEAVSVCIAD